MENTYWLKQTTRPLYPDLLWARPQNKQTAGKLLIIGGHAQNFNSVSAAYSAAYEAGIGTVRVILPAKLEKSLSKLFPESEYAPSNSIGSFSRQALDVFLESAAWADDVLLVGDFGRNSETEILLESFTTRYTGKLSVAGDALDYFLAKPGQLIQRDSTVAISPLDKLQKLAAPYLIKQSIDLAGLVKQIHSFAGRSKVSIVTAHSNQLIIASADKLSSTPSGSKKISPQLAGYISVWQIQHPKVFEALTSAIYDYLN